MEFEPAARFIQQLLVGPPMQEHEAVFVFKDAIATIGYVKYITTHHMRAHYIRF